jgi:hypothetical protein
MMTTNVADLVCDLHAEELRGVSDVLTRYAALVRKAAEGQVLSPDEAVSAASCAFELRLPPDRFDRDVVTMRAVMALDARIVEDEGTVLTREDNDAERQRLAELEKAVVEQKLRMRRLMSGAMERQNRRTEREQLAKANPHLFGNYVLSDNEWAAVRH